MWNTLDDKLKSLPTLQNFINHHVTFIRPDERSFYGITGNVGIKLLTKTHVEFSDPRDHRFSHNFNCASPLCKCGLEDETTSHYIFRCPLYNKHRSVLLSNVSDVLKIDVNILPESHLNELLLYGSQVYNVVVNQLIVQETIRFVNKNWSL